MRQNISATSYNLLLTLSEAAVKEMKEQTDLYVKPNKLLAILNKRCHHIRRRQIMFIG